MTEPMTGQGTVETAKGTASSGSASSPPRSEKTPPDPARQRQFRIMLAVAAILLLVGGIWAWRYFGSYVSTDDAQVDGHINPISARVSGYVTEVDVDDNQFVEKGAVLVRIDPSDYQVAVEKAESRAGKRQSLRKRHEQQCAHYQREYEQPALHRAGGCRGRPRGHRCGAAAGRWRSSSIKGSRGQQRQGPVRCTALQAARRQAGNFPAAIRTGRHHGTATAAGVAAARDSAAAALQQVAQARAKLAQAERSAIRGNRAAAGGHHARQADSAQARVGQKQAELEQAQLNLQYTTVVAPVSGRGQQERGSRNECPGRPAVVPSCRSTMCGSPRISKRRSLRKCASASASRSRGRLRPRIQRPSGEHCRRQRRPLQPAAAGKRHRQLREGGAARSGENRARSRPE